MKKTIIAIISVVLILASVAVGVTAYASDGYTLPVSEWGDRLGADNEQEKPEDATPGGDTQQPGEQNPGIIVNPLGVQIDTAKISFTSYEVPSRVYVKDNAKILSATVLPEQTTYKELVWSVEFVDPSAQWAADKNASDYIKITPAEDTLSVSVECLQPFGEEIAITVMCKQNSAFKDSCIVGFTQYVESYMIQYDSSNSFDHNYAPPEGFFTSDFECTSGIDGPEHKIRIVYTLSQVFTTRIAEYVDVAQIGYGIGELNIGSIGLDRFNSEWRHFETYPIAEQWTGEYEITFNMDRDILTPPSGTTFDDKTGDEIAELIRGVDTCIFRIRNHFGIPPVDIYVTLNPICTQSE